MLVASRFDYPPFVVRVPRKAFIAQSLTESLRVDPSFLRHVDGFYSWHRRIPRQKSAALSQRVLPALKHLLRDLLPKFDRIKRLMFAQPPQNRELRAQHVAIGDSSDDFLRG